MASQLVKKAIGNNQVDGTKIELLNAQAFNALNSSAAQTEIFNFSAANNFQFNVQIDANSNAIINLPTAVNPGDAINFGQAQGLISGLSWKQVTVSATTTTLPTYTASAGVLTATTNAALAAQDGVTLTIGQRLLVKNETGGNAPNNGIYVLTQVGSVSLPYILTRSSDANTAVLLQSSAVEVGVGASTQAGFLFFENLPIATINTSNVGFIAISSGISYTFGNGLLVTGSNVTVKPDAAGAITVSGSGVAVAVDNSTIAISSDQLIVKTAGITGTQLAAASVDENKIVSTTFSTSGAIIGGSGTKVAVAVDGSTVNITTNALHAVTSQVDQLLLNGTDITNQYKDVSFPITGTGSVEVSYIGGLIQANSNFSVSATGGVAGVGRITFLSELATGGSQALVSGDTLVVGYMHF